MKIEKTYHFLSGLPRSGSTVLAAILSQNPEVYATPTSPLLDQLIFNQNVWHQIQAVKANPLPEQLDNLTRRLINAIWCHIEKPIIIDKNRGWGKNMPASTILFGEEIKMVATTRDIPSIMASWLKILKNNPYSYMDQLLMQKGLAPTDENKMNEMWENMVRDCVEGLLKAKQDAGNRLLLINYDELVENPEESMKKIETFLNLPEWKYDFENIQNNSNDDDLAAWGLRGMHEIRQKLQKTSNSPEEVLGSRIFEKFAKIDENLKYL